MSLRPPLSHLFPYTTLFRSRAPSTVPASVLRCRQDLLAYLRLNPLIRRELRQGWKKIIGRCQADARVVTGDLVAELAELTRSEEHTSELQSHVNLVCRLLLE